MRGPTRAALALAALVCVLAAPRAHGAIPNRHGGTLTLPSPVEVRALDPAQVRTSFEATLIDAVFDGMYAATRDGAVRPVLADGPPELTLAEGGRVIARVRLRPGLRHHGHQPVLARHVVRAIQRVSRTESAWLLGALATEGGRPLIRELDASTVELTFAGRGVRPETWLAASPFAVLIGGDLRRAPMGTGPFRVRLDGRGGIELAIFRNAAEGASWIDRVRFVPPVSRDEEVRAFELEQLDGSWRARSLYGGEPSRATRSLSLRTAVPVLLVPNRARALRDAARWGGVARTIDRRRLERLGLAPDASLGVGLPPPRLPEGAAPRGARLRMAVRGDREDEARLAEAIAGMLDEAGVHLEVAPWPADRYDAAIAGGDWDLRLAWARPPLPGPGARAGAALAAAGQSDRARQLAPFLDDPARAAEAALELGALVLGHEQVALHHRADVRGLALDFLGRLSLADASFARAPRGGPR